MAVGYVSQSYGLVVAISTGTEDVEGSFKVWKSRFWAFLRIELLTICEQLLPVCRWLGSLRAERVSDFATTGAAGERDMRLISFRGPRIKTTTIKTTVRPAAVAGIRTQRGTVRLGAVDAIARCLRPSGNGVASSRRIVTTSPT